MKILFFDFGAYTYDDVLDCFERAGIESRTVSYCFSDKNNDDFFIHRFSKFLKEDKYDAVFSVNFFPLVARCCYRENIKYISWSYDNPLNVPGIEKTLGLSCNYVFLFDRIQVEGYLRQGFDNVYHLPLAANVRRLDQIRLSAIEHKRFDSEISFVGKLYDSEFDGYMKLLSQRQRGFVEGINSLQQNLYGCYILDELIDEKRVNEINAYIKSVHPETSFELSPEALTYAMSARITRDERLLLLGLLSGKHQLKLYTREQNEILSKAECMGSCGYLEEMPRIFKASKININITLKMLQSGIPLRGMDIMGAGGFLLSNYQPELAEFFEDGREMVMYESVEDAVAKADFYLKNDELRMEIASRGHQKVSEEFSYESAFKTIFDTAKI